MALAASGIAATDLGLLMVFAWELLVLGWLFMVAVSGVWCIGYAMRGKLVKAALCALLPAALIQQAVPFGPYALQHAGDELRFLRAKPEFDRQVAASPTGERLLFFDWDGGLLIAWRAIIFDETDQVALPKQRWSASWRARADKTELADLCSVDPLWSHYYIGDFAGGC